MATCFDALIWQERLRTVYSTEAGYDALNRLASHKWREQKSFTMDGSAPKLEAIRMSYTRGVVPLITGCPFYLAKEVTPLVRAGAASLPRSWRLLPEMMFKNSGFVWFEDPIVMESGTIPLVGMGWFPEWSTGVIPITGQEDVPFTAEDSLHVVFYGSLPSIEPVPITVYHMGTKETMEENILRLKTLTKDFDRAPTWEKMLFFAAFLSFVNQRILERFQVSLPRQWKRQRVRQNKEPLEGVEVIRLRRSYHENLKGSSRNVEWSCRWLVSGHWRNQFLPLQKTHSPRWIMPYCKGPDDKPFKLRPGTTLFTVER